MSFNTGIGTRAAVVTGASSLKGIGYHTSLRFAQEGWAVAMIDMFAEGLEKAAGAVLGQVPPPPIQPGDTTPAEESPTDAGKVSVDEIAGKS